MKGFPKVLNILVDVLYDYIFVSGSNSRLKVPSSGSRTRIQFIFGKSYEEEGEGDLFPPLLLRICTKRHKKIVFDRQFRGETPRFQDIHNRERRLEIYFNNSTFFFVEIVLL